MESFALSETLKYLFLLFTHTTKSDIGTKTFTTEGHVLTAAALRQLDQDRTGRCASRNKYAGSSLVCPVYEPWTLGGLQVGIKGRFDYEYTATLVDMPTLGRQDWWDEYGICIAPPIIPPYV